LSLKESILVYLDISGGLQKLMEDCKSFNEPQTMEAVYRLCVSVNPSDVIELDPVLGDWILHDPLKASALFQYVCFVAIKTLSLVEKIETQNQGWSCEARCHGGSGHRHDKSHEVHPGGQVPLPKRWLPVLNRCTLCHLFALNTHFGSPMQSDLFMLSLGTFSCFCPLYLGFHHIRVHTPGATESATVGNNLSCTMCSSPLKEDVKFRVLGDKQLVELVHVKALDALKAQQQSSLRYQSVTLFLRDELCNSMRMGHLYRVLGFPVHVQQWQSLSWSVEANNIQLWEPAHPHNVSLSFQEMLKATAGSPWRFSAVAAHCFGLEVAPPGLYNVLKMALLLSLVQTRAATNDTTQNLDLLTVTSDTLIVDRLMTYSLNMSAHGVRHQATGEMFASLSRDTHGAGTANIHAGSALLATGGICMLGDLGCYRKERLDAIQSVLEGGAVSVFIPGKKYGEDADQQVSFPVQCSFWALTDASRQSGKMSENVLIGTADLGSISSQLADAFGLVVDSRDTMGDCSLFAQSVHTLQQAVLPAKHLYSTWEFSAQDYKELVAHARSLQVELSPEAEKMIHGYYMASRRVRTQTHGVKMSVGSIKLLVSLAEAHCKLSLRTRVLEEDAVIAVLLCENSVTLKHGSY
ncbi:unnamed protein product, partial [Tetraodon nigroviridis]